MSDSTDSVRELQGSFTKSEHFPQPLKEKFNINAKNHFILRFTRTNGHVLQQNKLSQKDPFSLLLNLQSILGLIQPNESPSVATS